MATSEIRKASLNRLINATGKSAAEFCRDHDLDPSYISQLLNGHRNIGEKAAKKIEEKVGLESGYLDISVKNEVALSKIEPWDEKTPLNDEDVALPYYKEVEFSAGSGVTHVIEERGRTLRFSRKNLKDAGVDPRDAACGCATGDSMADKIGDGATIGIDRSKTQIKDGKIYAIDHDGMLRVKYLHRLPNGGLKLRSHNQDYEDEILSKDDLEKVSILGWVFWWSSTDRW